MVAESRKCVVQLLNDNKMEIHLQPKLLSSDLLDIVASHFNLKEKEYFGLCYFDNRDQRCWLRPDKKALDHSFQKTTPIQLHFAVRLFTPCVSMLKDNTTVELFYLQARQLIFKGDLVCDSETSFLLASYVLQATHGDYVSDAIGLEDLKTKDVMPVSTMEEHPTPAYREQKVLENYQKLEGIGKTEAILSYLGIVERLPLYGICYHNVKDKSQVSWKLGLSARGITMYEFQDKTAAKKTYLWSQMENMYYRDKKFSMEYSETQRPCGRSVMKKATNNGLNRINSIRRSMSQKVKLYSYYCSSASVCREMWYMAVSYHKLHLERKTGNSPDHLSPKSIRQLSKNLSRSSSISSMRSMNSTKSTKDNISDSASYYYSLDGESISSSQVLAAEEDLVSALVQRKAFLEQQLMAKKELLNEICLRESELTGLIPTDIPDSPTHPGLPMRRRMGTSFEFDDSILRPPTGNNMEDRELDLLQRDYEIQKQITFAAQRLARDPIAKRSVRKKREASYQKSLVKLKTMEQQLEYLKRETARETFEGLTKLTRKDEGGSQGDSLGPIDVETSSYKSQDSLHDIPVVLRRTSSVTGSNAAATRRPRESMYLAAPVVNPGHHGNPLMTSLHALNDRVTLSPPVNSSVLSPRYDADTDSYLDYEANFDDDDSDSDEILPPPPIPRHHSTRHSARIIRPHKTTRVKLKSHFHNSAGHIDRLQDDGVGDDVHNRSTTHDKYLCDEFTNTGVYTHVSKDHFSSNPAIPNSFTAHPHPQQQQQLQQQHKRVHMSPATLRRLDELALSPKKKYPVSRTNSNDISSIDHYSPGVTDVYTASYTSLTSSEPPDDYWAAQSEETLV